MTSPLTSYLDAFTLELAWGLQYENFVLNKLNLTPVLVLPVGFRAQEDYMKDLKKVRKNIDEVIINFK